MAVPFVMPSGEDGVSVTAALALDQQIIRLQEIIAEIRWQLRNSNYGATVPSLDREEPPRRTRVSGGTTAAVPLAASPVEPSPAATASTSASHVTMSPLPAAEHLSLQAAAAAAAAAEATTFGPNQPHHYYHHHYHHHHYSRLPQQMNRRTDDAVSQHYEDPDPDLKQPYYRNVATYRKVNDQCPLDITDSTLRHHDSVDVTDSVSSTSLLSQIVPTPLSSSICTAVLLLVGWHWFKGR